MHKVLGPGLALIGGLWTLTGPWLFGSVTSTGAGMSHMGTMSGMSNQADASFLGVGLNPNIYYWHVVPGVLAIVLALALGLATMPGLKRLAAAMLTIVAVWTLAGPWVLPMIGLGSSMTMGLDLGSIERHVLPGGVLLVAAILAIGVVREPRQRFAAETSQISLTTKS